MDHPYGRGERRREVYDVTFENKKEKGGIAILYETKAHYIYSVSTDTHFTHKAWHDSSDTIRKIKYIMVGDPTGVLSRNFGVMIEDAGLAECGTFVIDPQGRIQIIEINAGGIGRDASELLQHPYAKELYKEHRQSSPFRYCDPPAWIQDRKSVV